MNLCKDCKFVERECSRPLCLHEKAVSSVSPVDGSVNRYFCDWMRNAFHKKLPGEGRKSKRPNSDGFCGKEGKLFESRIESRIKSPKKSSIINKLLFWRKG